MAQGLAIDLKTGQRVGIAEADHLHAGHDRAGVRRQRQHPAGVDHRPRLDRAEPSLDAKKRNTNHQVARRRSAQTFRFVTLWISQAPQSSVGTPQAPGHISVNELELFAAE